MPIVLFVDDSKSVRRAFGAKLAKEGYEVVLAADGDEALVIVDSQPIDVVILDVHMQRLGGVATMARLRATRPALPIVLHSSYRESDVLARSQHKPDAYVNKSGTGHELKLAVADLLAQRCGAEHSASPSIVLRVDDAEPAPPRDAPRRGCGDDGGTD